MKLQNFAILLLGLTAAAMALSDADQAVRNLTDSLSRSLPSTIERCTLAVFPLRDESASNQGAGTAVAEGIILHISKNPRFSLIDRDAFQKAMSEIALSQSGAIEESAALKAGQGLSARYILTGTIVNAFGQKRISARITRTETSELVCAASVTVPEAGLNELQKSLLGERLQVSSAIFRSVLLPGWGQFYTDHPVRGGISMAVCLGALGATIWAITKNSSTKNDYDAKSSYALSDAYSQDLAAGRTTETQYLAEKKNLYQKYSDANDQMILFIAITGGVWVLNITDATVAGFQAKRAFKPYFALNSRGNPSFGFACALP